MNATLFGHTWRSQRVKLVVVFVALFLWGMILPIVYASFGEALGEIMESGIFPEELTQFGGGDVFSLSGSIALGTIHPIALILCSVFAVGFTVAAFAGERQRGTLEVILARPVSRRSAYVTILVAGLLFIGLAMAGILLGAAVGAGIGGVSDELALERMPIVWLNGWLLFAAIGSIGLAASVSFDRLSPALGITVAFTVVSYFLEVIGQLWPDAEFLRPYSVFHHFQAKPILQGELPTGDLALLAAIAVAAIAYALVVFPRRDLAAPS